MTTYFTTYKTATGQIIANHISPQDTVPLFEADETVFEGSYSLETYRISLPDLTPVLKTQMTTIISGQTPIPINTATTFFNITPNTTANIFSSGTQQVGSFNTLIVDDDSLELSFTASGQYTVEFTNPLYLTTTFIIEVTA